MMLSDGPADSTGHLARGPACEWPASPRQTVFPMATDRRNREDGLVGITRRYRILVAILAALTASGAAGPAVARGGDGQPAPGARAVPGPGRGARGRRGAMGHAEGEGRPRLRLGGGRLGPALRHRHAGDV